MYCLLCHGKIPRLRAWRTKSEFCCDEHAEAYKNQMLDRLMVNEGDGGKKPEKEKAVPRTVEEIAATEKEKAKTPVRAAKEELEVGAPQPQAPSGGTFGLSRSSTLLSNDRTAEPAASKDQTAEQALAALRELAESAAQRSKGKLREAEAETPAGDPLGEMALTQTSAPSESEDVFDELRELAGRALPAQMEDDGDEADAGLGVGDLDMVTRSSALERLMQEAVGSELPDDDAKAGGSLEIDEMLQKDAEPQAEAVLQASEPPVEKAVAEEVVAESSEAAPEAAREEEQQPIAAAEVETEETAEVAETASEQPSEEMPAEPAEKAPSLGRGNVVSFPSASAERADEPEEEPPQVAKTESKPSSGRAPDQDTKAARSSEPRKPASHPLLRSKMALEPLLDLFATDHGEPAVEESQAGWDEFVRQVRGGRASLKEVNGVIETKVLPSLPPGPQPARAVSDLASDFALLDTLPATEDGPRLEMQPPSAEIAGFDAAFVHPELVFLNFSLSTTQASGLVDVAEWISRSPLPATHETPSELRPAESFVMEPTFTLSVPSGFLLRCTDLSLSEDPGFLAGELLMMGTLSTDTLGEARPGAAGGTGFSGEVRNLNQPRMGTEFPDRLFGGVEGASTSTGRLAAGELAGAEPASRDLPSGTFSPIEGAGKEPGGKGSRGVFEPVFETKRPLDRDLSDYV